LRASFTTSSARTFWSWAGTSPPLKKEAKSDPDLTRRLQEFSKKILDIAKRLHSTARQIHPSILEDLGLGPALRQECDSFGQAWGIPTVFTAKKVPVKLSLDVALCLYRVVQESLRNVRQHARDTDKVWVSLRGRPGGILLRIKDRGDGFELDEALRKGGLGLISMEARIRAANGKLTIRSQLRKGTTVTAFIPLKSARRENAPEKKKPA
jgi:signal transduction histidine kinase